MFELIVQLDSGERETIEVEPAEIPHKLTDVLRANGFPLNTRCGSLGLCDGCAVELLEGSIDQKDGQSVSATSDKPVRLLTCVHRLPLNGRAHLRIPTRSLIAGGDFVVTDFSIEDAAGRKDASLTSAGLGVAVDIGTTTVAAILVDLKSGLSLAKSTRLNQQAALGDDVISRIQLCQEHPEMIGLMRLAVTRETLVPVIRDLLATSGASLGDIRRCVIAGNTTMLHLLLGVDPTPMGSLPFTPAFLNGRIVSWNDIGISEGPEDASVRLLPGMSAFVGADISAGVLATRLFEREATCLLLDIGTNGEMILYHKGSAFACATAAGPSFEGVGMSCGSRAMAGAVSHVQFKPESRIIVAEVIGGKTPTGICGSGYVDFLADGRRAGLLDSFGRITEEAAAWPCFEHGADGRPRLRLGPVGGPSVSESDLSKLLQAKAAMASGVKILLEKAGIGAAEVETFFLAGGFGLSVDVKNAIACGLLPGFQPAQVRPVGNTSLGGSFLTLMNESLAARMEEYQTRIEVVELNLEPSFQDHYIDSMILD